MLCNTMRSNRHKKHFLPFRVILNVGIDPNFPQKSFFSFFGFIQTKISLSGENIFSLATLSAIVHHIRSNQGTVEPRFNEPLFNQVLDMIYDILRPGQSYSKMYGIEPRYNEARYNEFLDITNIIRKPKRKVYLDITNYNVNTRQKISVEQINSQQILSSLWQRDSNLYYICHRHWLYSISTSINVCSIFFVSCYVFHFRRLLVINWIRSRNFYSYALVSPVASHFHWDLSLSVF